MKLIKKIGLALGLAGGLGLTGGALIGGSALADHPDPWFEVRYERVYQPVVRSYRYTTTVPVRFYNERNQSVALYMDGNYIGSLAPYEAERFWIPSGYHNVTYRAGGRMHTVSVNAFYGQPNRVVIQRPAYVYWDL
jgi:hypothetical protein